MLQAHTFPNREDLVQEVFQEVFEKLVVRAELENLESVGSIRRYLSVMASRAAADKAKWVVRAGKRFVAEESLEGYAAGRGTVSQAIANETSAAIESALGELTDRERTLVELTYLNELTFREAGELLGVEEEAARAIVRRAKEKIHTKLNGKV